jgi:hypothetical protein
MADKPGLGHCKLRNSGIENNRFNLIPQFLNPLIYWPTGLLLEEEIVTILPTIQFVRD